MRYFVRDPHGLDRHVEAVGRERGATIGTGASPLRPNIACSRSDCSVLVGRPVEGPPRWTSTTTSGSSRQTARPIVSALSARPGPRWSVTAERAAVGGAERGADAGDLVLGLEGPYAEVLALATARGGCPRRA